jgi:hypothetical protein
MCSLPLDTGKDHSEVGVSVHIICDVETFIRAESAMGRGEWVTLQIPAFLKNIGTKLVPMLGDSDREGLVETTRQVESFIEW